MKHQNVETSKRRNLGTARLAVALLAELPELKLAHGEFDRDQWVMLLPPGKTTTRDGTTLLVDREGADAVIAARAAHGVKIPFDINHATVHKLPKGEPADAYGWTDTLKFDEKRGLEAKVDWTDEGCELIQSGKYKYLSPVILYEKATRRIRRLHSVALTTTPAVPNMPALAATELLLMETDTMDGLLMKLLQEGGETAVASAEQLLGQLAQILKGKSVEVGNSAESILAAVIKLLEGESGGDEKSPEDKADAEVAATAREKLGLAADAGKEVVLRALTEARAHVGYTKNDAVKALAERVEGMEKQERKRRGAELREEYKAKLHPGDEEEMAWAVSCSEEDPERFVKSLRGAPDVWPEQGKTEGPPAKDKRLAVITAAKEEHAAGPEQAIATLTDYVNGALRDEGLGLLTPDEKTELAAV